MQSQHFHSGNYHHQCNIIHGNVYVAGYLQERHNYKHISCVKKYSRIAGAQIPKAIACMATQLEEIKFRKKEYILFFT